MKQYLQKKIENDEDDDDEDNDENNELENELKDKSLNVITPLGVIVERKITNTKEEQPLENDSELISEQTSNTQELNPYSTTIIPIVNDKVSRGRKKAVNVTTGTTSLKQKIVKKPGKL